MLPYYYLIDNAKIFSDKLKELNISDDGDFYIDNDFNFYIYCYDLFDNYSTDDSVKLTDHNFPILRESIADTLKLGLTVEDGLLLFCCRARARRPHPVMYKLIAQSLHSSLNELPNKTNPSYAYEQWMMPSKMYFSDVIDEKIVSKTTPLNLKKSLVERVWDWIYG